MLDRILMERRKILGLPDPSQGSTRSHTRIGIVKAKQRRELNRQLAIDKAIDLEAYIDYEHRREEEIKEERRRREARRERDKEPV